MATFPKMTLDQVIARLQDLRTKTGGDVGVIVRGGGRKYAVYIDAIGPVCVGKSNEHHIVSRGGTPVIKLYQQGE